MHGDTSHRDTRYAVVPQASGCPKVQLQAMGVRRTQYHNNAHEFVPVVLDASRSGPRMKAATAAT